MTIPQPTRFRVSGHPLYAPPCPEPGLQEWPQESASGQSQLSIPQAMVTHSRMITDPNQVSTIRANLGTLAGRPKGQIFSVFQNCTRWRSGVCLSCGHQENLPLGGPREQQNQQMEKDGALETLSPWIQLCLRLVFFHL